MRQFHLILLLFCLSLLNILTQIAPAILFHFNHDDSSLIDNIFQESVLKSKKTAQGATSFNNTQRDQSNRLEANETNGEQGKHRPLILTNPYRGESFSACLMWMDDYNRFIEWIAYHYQTLPLRHLVFFRDPKSVLDPTPIFDRWRPYMNITYWTDLGQYFNQTRSGRRAIEKLNRVGDSLDHHRLQQQTFYRGCLSYLKQQNRTWTMMTDTDEFLLPNSKNVRGVMRLMRKHGIIMDVLKMARQNGTYLKNEQQKQRWGEDDCITLQRNQFLAYESPREAIIKDVPEFLDGYRFQTLRFRHHRRKTIVGKSIVDTSKFNVTDVTPVSPHMILNECVSPFGKPDDLLYVNHYVGSWEYFDRPNDKRNKVQNRTFKFQKKNMLPAYYKASMGTRKGDKTRSWIKGFVDYFGKDKALYLLKDAGFPFNNETALPMFEDIFKA